MFYAMHYFMSRVIIFTKDSAEKAVEGLRRPHKLNFAQTLTSTLLNLQIKQAMQGLLSTTSNAVLESLDCAMSGPKTKAAWADIFCAILILCMCIEAVQVASDSYAMAALRKDPKCGLCRMEICRRLDEEPFKHLTEIFHMAYKTAKANPKSRIGFNPIRNGLRVDLDEGVTPQMVKLVSDIKAIITARGKDLLREVWYSITMLIIAGNDISRAAAENPAFDSTPDLLTHHMAFRKRNSGRLVSKFLKSFM